MQLVDAGAEEASAGPGGALAEQAGAGLGIVRGGVVVAEEGVAVLAGEVGAGAASIRRKIIVLPRAVLMPVCRRLLKSRVGWAGVECRMGRRL